LIDRVELRGDGVALTVKIAIPCSLAGVRTSRILPLTRFVPLRMKRRGVENRIIVASGDDLPRNVDPALLKAIARARAWFEELSSGRVRSLADIARRENITRRYVERLSRLAFTAPSMVTAICQGRQPAELCAETLLNRIDLPLDWPTQLELLGSALGNQ
jgi:site-specific DNA recombinase